MTSSASTAPASDAQPPSSTSASSDSPSSSSRALLAVLGAWLMLSVTMAFIAGSNFGVVDPGSLRNADEIYAAIPEPERRPALRYIASELNRYDFAVYDKVNVALAVLALVLAAVCGRARGWRGLALGVALILALVFAIVITPSITEMGRAIDFVPRDPPPPEVTEFKAWHGIVMGVELTKMVLVTAVMIALIARPRR